MTHNTDNIIEENLKNSDNSVANQFQITFKLAKAGDINALNNITKAAYDYLNQSNLIK